MSGTVDGADVRELVRSVGAVLHLVLGDDPVRRQWAAALLAALDDGTWNPLTDPTPPASIPPPEPPDPGPMPWTPQSQRLGSAATGTTGARRALVGDDFRRRHSGGGVGGVGGALGVG